MISRNFIKSSFIYTLAGALPMASAIILLPFYISFLPTAVYGALSLYLAFSLFVQVLVTYSFDSSLYIHYHEFKGDPGKLASFVSSTFIFMMMIGAGTGIVLVVCGDMVFKLVFDDPAISFFPFGFMAVAIGIFQGLFKVYSNLIQSRENPELFFWSNLLLFSLIAGLTIAGLYVFPSTLMGPIGGRVVAGGIASVWVLFRIYREFGLHFNYALLKSTFSYNHYTFIYQIQQWIINYFDRFLMVFFLPLSSIGVYDFSLKCLVVIEFIMGGLHNSFYPKVVSTIMAQKDKGSTIELNRYYHGLTAVIMLMISSGILVLPFLVNLLDKSKGYQEAIAYFPYIAVIYILKSLRLYFAAPFGILKYTKPLSVIYMAVSAIKILLMLLLMTRFGILGVVISSMVAAVFEIVFLKYSIKDRFKFQYNAFKLIVTPLVLLVTVLLVEPFAGNEYPLIVHGSYLLIVVVFLFWVYRNELKTLNFNKLLRS